VYVIQKDNNFHKILFPELIPEVDREVFLQNGNNTPWPREENQTSEILGAISPVLNYLTKIKKYYQLPGLTDNIMRPYIIKNPNKEFYEIIYKNRYIINEHRINLLYNLHDPVAPTLKNFAINVYDICQRYDNTVDLDEEWELRKPLLNVLNRVCGPFMEYIGSPLTVNALSMGYFTEHSEDQFFSANYNCFTRIWSIPGIIGPDITMEQMKKSIIWSIMSLKICPNNYFILIINDSIMAQQQILASKLKIMENAYVKHWCQIQQHTQTGIINTHLFIITETKRFSQDICEEITKMIQNRYVRTLWSDFQYSKIEINIDNIIKENSNLIGP
jgi:hypothetical protein